LQKKFALGPTKKKKKRSLHSINNDHAHQRKGIDRKRMPGKVLKMSHGRSEGQRNFLKKGGRANRKDWHLKSIPETKKGCKKTRTNQDPGQMGRMAAQKKGTVWEGRATDKEEKNYLRWPTNTKSLE